MFEIEADEPYVDDHVSRVLLPIEMLGGEAEIEQIGGGEPPPNPGV